MQMFFFSIEMLGANADTDLHARVAEAIAALCEDVDSSLISSLQFVHC